MNILIVIGTAPCVINDVDKFVHMCNMEWDTLAVGVDAALLPIKWKFIATGEVDDIPTIRRYCSEGYKLISYDQFPGVDIIQPLNTWEGGSSALLGVKAAIAMGYKKIILCGCPMEGPNPGHPGADYKMFQKKWDEQKNILSPFVRSMSGWTKNLLGEPTEECLND